MQKLPSKKNDFNYAMKLIQYVLNKSFKMDAYVKKNLVLTKKCNDYININTQLYYILINGVPWEHKNQIIENLSKQYKIQMMFGGAQSKLGSIIQLRFGVFVIVIILYLLNLNNYNLFIKLTTSTDNELMEFTNFLITNKSYEDENIFGSCGFLAMAFDENIFYDETKSEAKHKIFIKNVENYLLSDFSNEPLKYNYLIGVAQMYLPLGNSNHFEFNAKSSFLEPYKFKKTKRYLGSAAYGDFDGFNPEKLKNYNPDDDFKETVGEYITLKKNDVGFIIVNGISHTFVSLVTEINGNIEYCVFDQSFVNYFLGDLKIPKLFCSKNFPIPQIHHSFFVNNYEENQKLEYKIKNIFRKYDNPIQKFFEYMKTDHGTNLVSLHSIQTYNINYLSKFKLMPVKIKTDRIISFYKTIANATRFYYNLSETEYRTNNYDQNDSSKYLSELKNIYYDIFSNAVDEHVQNIYSPIKTKNAISKYKTIMHSKFLSKSPSKKHGTVKSQSTIIGQKYNSKTKKTRSAPSLL